VRQVSDGQDDVIDLEHRFKVDPRNLGLRSGMSPGQAPTKRCPLAAFAPVRSYGQDAP
jgi:hypothetical protein